jgi:hypothetical protein
MFKSNNFAASRTDTGEDVHFEQLAAFVTGLMTMLSPHPVLHVKSDGYENVPFDSVSLKNTRLEMYDYIRHTNILNARRKGSSAQRSCLYSTLIRRKDWKVEGKDVSQESRGLSSLLILWFCRASQE